MKTIFGVFLVVVLGVAGWLFFEYGSLEPCRMLAKDMSEDTVVPFVDALGLDTEQASKDGEAFFRLLTSQYDSMTCADMLVERWLEEKPE